jgi:NADH dehydrogenase
VAGGGIMRGSWEELGKRRPRTVIVGAGFAGLWAARGLALSPVDVLFIDRNNYHLFLPLLYQVAAAELEAKDIACPVRILRRADHGNFLYR